MSISRIVLGWMLVLVCLLSDGVRAQVAAPPGTALVACDTGPPLALLPPEPSAAPDDDFVDPVTGHRIVRLSRLENGGSSFYFTQNEFNCRGNKLVFLNAHAPIGRWLYSIDLETFDIQPLANDEFTIPVAEVVAPKRNEVLYLARSLSEKHNM